MITNTSVPFAPLRRVAHLLGATLLLVSPGLAQRTTTDLTIPPPRGMLSDFASVVSPERATQIEALAQFVRTRSGGEIAVVTLPDLAGRDVAEVALRIGREWKVGAKADVGDARRNAGIVVLVVPKESSSDGRGYISIQTGQGVEGFIPDAVAGDIRREAAPYLQQRDYGSALYLITLRLSERYAAEFGFSLDSAGVPRVERRGARRGQPSGVSPFFALMLFVILIALLSRGGRGGCASFLVGQAIGQAMGRGNRWGGGGGGFGGGGGGGGGFGGFGGGGGFSGGGSSGSW